MSQRYRSRELKAKLGMRLRASLLVCHGPHVPPDLDDVLSLQFDQGCWEWKLGEGGLWVRAFDRRPVDTWRSFGGCCRLCGRSDWERRNGGLCGPCDSSWRGQRPDARAKRSLRWQRDREKLAWERQLRDS